MSPPSTIKVVSLEKKVGTRKENNQNKVRKEGVQKTLSKGNMTDNGIIKEVESVVESP